MRCPAGPPQLVLPTGSRGCAAQTEAQQPHSAMRGGSACGGYGRIPGHSPAGTLRGMAIRRGCGAKMLTPESWWLIVCDLGQVHLPLGTPFSLSANGRL